MSHHPVFFFDIAVDEIAYSGQERYFKNAYAATVHAVAGKTEPSEEHASQHATHDSAGHASHEPAAGLLLKGVRSGRELFS